jgi:hypothetical protein
MHEGEEESFYDFDLKARTRQDDGKIIQCLQSSGKHGGSVERMELFR